MNKKRWAWIWISALCLAFTACSHADTEKDRQKDKTPTETDGEILNGQENIPDDRLSEDTSDRLVTAEIEIPTLSGGALPFSDMRTLRADNYPDGTYYYSDITADGNITVVNSSEKSVFVPDIQDMEDYLPACALSLGNAKTFEMTSVEENEDYSLRLGYPVYIVQYIANEGEDARKWTVFAVDNDICTYLYGFCETPDVTEDMSEIYQSIFTQLHWSSTENEEE